VPKLTSAEIRDSFLHFFEKNGHTRVRSSSLIPSSDPTLLFTNAGMVQFKDIFLDPKQATYKTATSSQKCLRVGGKHNDLENVGITARHLTFFEMLGNFSFGDYFKEGAITLAWKYLTEVLNLPKDRLYATVFHEDGEAAQIWIDKIGLNPDRVVALGEKDNFWSMGDTGPCGPCSEIIYDQGSKVGCGKPSCSVECDCDRFLEIWNLVFMEFNRSADGKTTPLPTKCIDTGMGLERLAAVIQGVQSNYHIDIFQKIIQATENLAGVKYQGASLKVQVAHHVIADHIRSMCFLIADGILPSNEGRGYVLRRLIRRAMRHSRNLGMNQSFLYKLASELILLMGEAFPEIDTNQQSITHLIQEEEEQFLETLERGMGYLDKELAALKETDQKTLSGKAAFRLYDTYGFPVDLTEDILKTHGLQLDNQGFEKALEEHREKARGSWKHKEDEKANLLKGVEGLAPTPFLGNDELKSEAKVIAILSEEGSRLDKLDKGRKAFLVLSKTPLYAERGGQATDFGQLIGDGVRGEISDAQWIKEVIVHETKLQEGTLQVGDLIEVQVDQTRRNRIARNHTLTHLIHAALRSVLGPHVQQRGSYLDDKRLTFDFSHPKALTEDQLEAILFEVNRNIWANHTVTIDVLPIQEALDKGALAFFEDKYGETVRVIQVGEMSTELCGGCHVKKTGEIGLCRIQSESSIGSRLRRIEAMSSDIALAEIQRESQILRSISKNLDVAVKDVEKRIETLLQEKKKLNRQLREGGPKQGRKDIKKELLSTAREVNGIKVVTGEIPSMPQPALREIADELIDQLRSGMVLLGSKFEDRAFLVLKLSQDLIDRYNAKKMIDSLAKTVSGGGGGRPDMAQAGGRDPGKIKQALAQIDQLI
jgi:alanyl-tRNA synthetase